MVLINGEKEMTRIEVVDKVAQDPDLEVQVSTKVGRQVEEVAQVA